jgi:hypothetical protein
MYTSLRTPPMMHAVSDPEQTEAYNVNLLVTDVDVVEVVPAPGRVILLYRPALNQAGWVAG